MSTCADPKTLPATAEYRAEHERIFGKREDVPRTARRGVFVTRCELCDGVQLPEGALRWNCSRCGGKDCSGSVDASTAPEIHRESRVPVVTDRYMEGVRAVDGTDIGSRAKRNAYMKARGLADADDFKGTWERAAKERAEIQAGTHERTNREVRESVERAFYKLYKY